MEIYEKAFMLLKHADGSTSEGEKICGFYPTNISVSYDQPQITFGSMGQSYIATVPRPKITMEIMLDDISQVNNLSKMMAATMGTALKKFYIVEEKNEG
jgi:hypothetical protein